MWQKIPAPRGPVALPTEFTANRRQVDLLAQVGPDDLVHIEFETWPDPELAVRMLDCRAQIMKQYPGKRLRQIVIVLATGQVDGCDDPGNGFQLGLKIVYVRECEPAEFLTDPALAPLAVLAAGDRVRRRMSLVAALRLIHEKGGESTRELLDAALTLATIRLDANTIDEARRETDMTVESLADFYSESEIGQELLRRGEARGRAEGEARTKGALAALLRLKFGDHPAIPGLAQELATWPDTDAAVQAITAAAMIEDLDTARQP